VKLNIMARVTYGSGVTELAGSIGGVTYQKNASGNIAKLRSNPTVNPTARQAGYQTNMAYLVSFWPTLSQDNKDRWDAFAIAHTHTTNWGEVKTLSGYQWFLSCNLNRLVEYDSIVPAPPAWVAYPPPDAFTLAVTVDHIRPEWAAPWTSAGWPRFYLSLPLRQSSLKLRRALFFVKSGGWMVPLNNYDLTTEFEALTGVTWAAFFNSANCSIICHITDCGIATGLNSAFTSAIVKLN